MTTKGKILSHRNYAVPRICKLCGKEFVSPYPRQFYCEPCSTSQDLKRKKLGTINVRTGRRRDQRRDIGKDISADCSMSVARMYHEVKFKWLVRVAIPFSWSGSKNAIYALRRKGHVALRREASDYRNALILALKSALRGTKIVHNKLWIEIFVEKSNHKGDAANFVDGVCDAVKVATGLDDRWFAIRFVDWSVNKHEPQLMVGVGQENVEDAQICSYCGRILDLSRFDKNRATNTGASRICKECKVGGNPANQFKLAGI